MALFTEVPTATQVNSIARPHLPQKRDSDPALEKLTAALDDFHAAIRPDRRNNPTRSSSQASPIPAPFLDILTRCQAALEGCQTHPALAKPFSENADLKTLAQNIADYKIAAEQYLLAEHIPPILAFSREAGVVLTLRGIDPAGIEQRAQGTDAAKPKPHSIRAKTIKAITLLEAYGEVEGRRILDDLRKLKTERGIMIEGLVGHWDPPEPQPAPRRLLGFYVDREDSIKGEENEPLCKRIGKNPAQATDQPASRRVGLRTVTRPPDPEHFYFPIDTRDFQQLEASTAPLQKPGWRPQAYAADYDLHEILVIGGAGGAHPAISGPEEDKLIARLNRAIHGEVTLSSQGVSDHTVIQHGAQNTYLAHVRNKEPWAIDKLDQRVMQRTLPVTAIREGKLRHITTSALHNEIYSELGIRPKQRWLDQDPEPQRPRSLRRSSSDSGWARGGSPHSQTSSPRSPASSPLELSNQSQFPPVSATGPKRRKSTDTSASSRLPMRLPMRRGSMPHNNTHSSSLPIPSSLSPPPLPMVSTPDANSLAAIPASLVDQAGSPTFLAAPPSFASFAFPSLASSHTATTSPLPPSAPSPVPDVPPPRRPPQRKDHPSRSHLQTDLTPHRDTTQAQRGRGGLSK
jgi:hypothetical protein